MSDEHPRRRARHALTGATSWAIVLITLVGLTRFPRWWLPVTAVCLTLFLLRAIFVLVYSVLGDAECRSWERTDWHESEDSPGRGGFAPSQVRHLILIPNYREPTAILRRTLDALAVQHRAAERLIVVLGMEEREQDSLAKGRALADEYAERFLEAIVTVHPAGLPGEVLGKSSNQAW